VNRQVQAIVYRLKKSFSERGMRGTMERVYSKFKSMSPAVRRERQRRAEAELTFDKTHNIETAGYAGRASLTIESPNWQHGLDYYPIDPDEFHTMFRDIDIDFSRFTFVDFGAGKGRAVLLASHYPFARIIGVEFSKELVEIARRNIANYSGPTLRRNAMEMHYGDATEFQIPNGPVVIYLYNPFGKELMEKLVNNVRVSLEREPRDFIVLYNTPESESLWLKLQSLRCVRSGQGFSEYRSVGV
jgi:SAM-dependent methyltransferase